MRDVDSNTAAGHAPGRSTVAQRLLGVLTLSLTLISIPRAYADEPVALGAGAYHTHPKGGVLGGDAHPPAAEYRGGWALGKAAPTNQWYSSVMFQRWSQPLHAHPMTYRAVEDGFELGLPTQRLVVEDGGSKRELRYLHAAAIVVSPLAFKPRDARLSRYSDWLAEISMGGAAGETLSATVLHGSPFSYYELTRGDVRFRLTGKPSVWSDPKAVGHDPRVAALTVDGHSYAIFAPTGATWDWAQPTELVLHLPANARYFSVAGLPDDKAATLQDFLAVAYAFPVNTRVEWSYDEKTSRARTVFHVETEAKEGQNRKTWMGLYPHQWAARTSELAVRHSYESVRGPIRLIEGNTFANERAFHGVLPTWAGLEDPTHKAAVDSILVGDTVKADQLYTKKGRGTYWFGKALGGTAQLLSVAEAEGRLQARDALLAKLKERLETWYDGRHATYFMQDEGIGTFVGHPQEYNSITDMNDHHFHYGYWLMAAAHIALRDPAWGAAAKWGGMTDKLVADIATAERGRADFPFLRNFDPYEGHSWASGIADFDAGNNQESSSEAVNAWAALVLLGEATGNSRLRDLGVYLYTTEVAAIEQYWFDIDHQVLAPEFGKPFASMVFGGKYAYNTWWTEEPRQILGINILPLTPASTYLAQDPTYIEHAMAALPGDVHAYQSRGVTDGTQADIWQDVLASFQALRDPDAALAAWDRKGTVEFGETRTHTLYWLLSLKEMGAPDFSVTADTSLYAVFKDLKGRRTYLAWNARDTPLKVSFSDGKTLEVSAHTLGRTH